MWIKTRFVHRLLVSAVISMVAGCGANTYSTGDPVSNVGAERVIRNPGLATEIKVVATRIDEKAGVKYAQVTIRNESGSSKSIRYRFDWFDADGVAVVGLNSAFVSIEIGPGESREIRSAGSALAADFRFTIAR